MSKRNHLICLACLLAIFACSSSRKQATDRQLCSTDSLRVTRSDSACYRRLWQSVGQSLISRQEIRFSLPDSAGQQYPEVLTIEETRLNYQSVVEDSSIQQTTQQATSTYKMEEEEHNVSESWPSRTFILTIFVVILILVCLIRYLWKNK